MLSYSYEFLNETTQEPEEFHVGPMMIISKLSIGLFIIPLMAYLESIAIAKGFAIKNGYKVDPTQELVSRKSVKITYHLLGGTSTTKIKFKPLFVFSSQLASQTQSPPVYPPTPSLVLSPAQLLTVKATSPLLQEESYVAHSSFLRFSS